MASNNHKNYSRINGFYIKALLGKRKDSLITKYSLKFDKNV